ncbi:MAG: hypothetical protein IKN03_05780 [Fibrobacter sp.]|nr:hypothetical protein [Fibrobacter sp.]
MKKYLLLVLCTVVLSWSISKPMETIENYNVMLLHDAYGLYNDDDELQEFEHEAKPTPHTCLLYYYP